MSHLWLPMSPGVCHVISPAMSGRGGGGVTKGQMLHCGRTAGTCIKDHPEEKEGGNIKHHMRMQQHNRTI